MAFVDILKDKAGNFIYPKTVTSAVYTPDGSARLDNELARLENLITGNASVAFNPNLVLVSDAAGAVATSTITSTELNYLDGVSSNVQDQINDKQSQINARVKLDGSTAMTGALTVNSFITSNYVYNSDVVGGFKIPKAATSTLHNPIEIRRDIDSIVFWHDDDGAGNPRGAYIYLPGCSATWPGSKVWHSENDGSGSGLDADLLDGLHSSSFINTSGGQTINGGLTVASGLGVTGDLSAGRVLSNGQVVAQNPIGSGNGTSGGLALKTDDSRGVAYLQVVNQAYNAQYGYMAFDTSGGVSWNGNAMIHAGNISSYLTSYTPRIVKLLDVTDTGGTLFSVNVAGYSMVRVLYNITNPSNNWAIGLYFYFNDTSSSSSFWYHSLDVSGTAVTANSWDSQNWGRVGSCSQYGNSSAGFADISLNKYHAYTAYCTENNRLIWGTCNSFDTVTTFNFLLSDIGLGNGHIEIWGMK